jgi:ABC-type cobalamin/Fe3+-siderophores transport system ATPase subunit
MGFCRFYLCDLQVHTPADRRQGYGDVGGPAPNEAFARRLAEAHAEAGVEVMAVSDHNRVDWYPVLREAGDEVGIHVFPALEFSVNRCHLLAVWDRTDQGYTLAQQFLSSLWSPGEEPFEANGDPRPVGHGQVLELAMRATDHKALVLAPHSTMRDIGLFASGVCTNRKDVVRSGLIAGFDVYGNKAADVLRNPAAEFGDIPPRWFVSGDVRSFADVGKRAVYLKLGETPTLEGLRQAFLMPDTRIRFPAALQAQWGKVAGARFCDGTAPCWPRLRSVRIKGGFHNGLDLTLGPGLNAVIGGKGTGKSTLIEILRYVLHAGEAAGQEAKGNREHNFKANAEAQVTFVDEAGGEYEVQRTGSKDRARLLRDGKDVPVDVERRVSVRVFGQRELQGLAERRDLLREFVATEGGAKWTDALATEKTLLATIKEQDSELERIEGHLSGLDDDEHELRDIEDRIKQANARGVGAHIDRLDALGDADTKIRRAAAWPEKVKEAVNQLAAVLPVPEVPDVPAEHTVIRDALAPLGRTVTEAASQLRAAADSAEAAIAAPMQAWEAQRTEERAEIEHELAEAGLTDPRELGNLQARARELQIALASLPQERRHEVEVWAERTTALQKLGDVRREKSRLVEDAARSLNASVGERVRIRVEPLADKAALLEVLEKAVRGQSVKSDQLRRLAETQTPVAVASAIREGQAKVEALGCSAATASKLCGLDSSTVRRIEETDAPDRIVVEVNLASPDGEDAWHDVTQVSPGQRATALLALVLAGGREPLIIDQPEDDLDNRYIYDEVVKVLADVCQSRQVIVATHNANIPILGDAEMVLALDAEAARGKVLACGGLEDAAVAEWSRKILEGGEEAFAARHRRYQAAGS